MFCKKILRLCDFSPHRAVYKQADVYILDDPLSAVDTHVGRHLVEDCICDFLQDKTRLLVTHQLQYLQAVDNILILNNVSKRGLLMVWLSNSVAFPFPAAYVSARKSASQFPCNLDLSKLTCFVNSVLFEIQYRMISYLM